VLKNIFQPIIFNHQTKESEAVVLQMHLLTATPYPLYAIGALPFMRKYWPLIPAILLLSYLTFKHFYTKHQVSNLHYGIQANELRKRLQIPIIEDNMKPEGYNEAISGLYWKANQQLPTDKEVLHVWKNAIPFSDTAGLYKESDGFRKKYNDSLYYQLIIHSAITGDTTVKRSGKLFIYNKSELLNIVLNDEQVDSVAKSWGLNYLVR
jgi:hypothetical protein